MTSASAAVVSLFLIHASSDAPNDVHGTAIHYVTEDMTVAENLREQLAALLGDPVGETLLPAITIEALKQSATWPGACTVQLRDL